MTLGRSRRLTDAEDVRFLVGGIRLGLVTTLIVCITGALYYSQTGDGANRPLLLALSAGFGLASLGMLALRYDRLVESRWRDTFFMAWSAVSVGGMALCLYLDGTASVNAFGLALPLAFAGLMYPLRGAIGVAVLDIAAFLLVGVLGPHTWAELTFATALLGCIALMCVWTAWWQSRQRAVLARLSRTDPLTGCMNRRGLEETVARALADDQRFALITLDLDAFKDVNDREGHAAGDAVLCAAVRALRDAVRPTDAVGRLGGDEFALVLPGAMPDVAARVLDRAQLALSQSAPASFGLASFPRDGASSDALFNHADAAVYRSKAERRGRSYGAASSAEAVLERSLDGRVERVEPVQGQRLG